MWSVLTNVTDRQTDGRTDAKRWHDRSIALAWSGKQIHNDSEPKTALFKHQKTSGMPSHSFHRQKDRGSSHSLILNIVTREIFIKMLNLCVKVFSNIADYQIGVYALPRNALTECVVNIVKNRANNDYFSESSRGPPGNPSRTPFGPRTPVWKPLQVCWLNVSQNTRTRYRANSWATFASICDDTNVSHRSPTTVSTCYIGSFLLSVSSKRYSLRERCHNFQLPHRTSVIKDKNFYEDAVICIGTVSIDSEQLYWFVLLYNIGLSAFFIRPLINVVTRKRDDTSVLEK